MGGDVPNHRSLSRILRSVAPVHGREVQFAKCCAVKFCLTKAGTEARLTLLCLVLTSGAGHSARRHHPPLRSQKFAFLRNAQNPDRITESYVPESP
jgi:hypothetical protein